jgi:hypothetical protein
MNAKLYIECAKLLYALDVHEVLDIHFASEEPVSTGSGTDRDVGALVRQHMYRCLHTSIVTALVPTKEAITVKDKKLNASDTKSTEVKTNVLDYKTLGSDAEASVNPSVSASASAKAGVHGESKQHVIEQQWVSSCEDVALQLAMSASLELMDKAPVNNTSTSSISSAAHATTPNPFFTADATLGTSADPAPPKRSADMTTIDSLFVSSVKVTAIKEDAEENTPSSALRAASQNMVIDMDMDKDMNIEEFVTNLMRILQRILIEQLSVKRASENAASLTPILVRSCRLVNILYCIITSEVLFMVLAVPRLYYPHCVNAMPVQSK